MDRERSAIRDPCPAAFPTPWMRSIGIVDGSMPIPKALRLSTKFPKAPASDTAEISPGLIPSSSMRMRTPHRIVPLASWSWRTSSWVITMRGSPERTNSHV